MVGVNPSRAGWEGTLERRQEMVCRHPTVIGVECVSEDTNSGGTTDDSFALSQSAQGVYFSEKEL